MKLLIASDIHGDIESAEALIQVFEKEKCDKILLLGDMLYHGPRNDLPGRYAPKEVIALLNRYKDKLKRILYEYGEERYAPQIAAAICRRRADKNIETTLELADIIRSAMPAAALRERQHPAKRSFQAIRIAVNDELGAVETVMKDAPLCLNPGGRLAIITFHSLEDRIVKNGMANAAKGCTCPPNFPVCVCGNKPKVKLITRKPLTASEEELEVNPRSRSAKLRVCEKL